MGSWQLLVIFSWGKAEGRGQRAEGERRKMSKIFIEQGFQNFCLLPPALCLKTSFRVDHQNLTRTKLCYTIKRLWTFVFSELSLLLGLNWVKLSYQSPV